MTDANDASNANPATNDTAIVTQAPAAAPAKKKPLKLSMGAQAALEDPAVLDAAVSDRRDELYALVDDTTLSDDTRAAVRSLVALASPNKPGMEEMEVAWKIPRINIAQPTTRSDAKPEAAKNGDLYTTSGQLLGRPLEITVLNFHEENINFPAEGNVPTCMSPDAKLGSPFGVCTECPHLPFGKQPGGFENQKKTDCQNNIVAVVMAKDDAGASGVYVIQFGKTSRKTGSVLLTLAGQQEAVWFQNYRLLTEKQTGEKGLYFTYKVETTSKNTPPDVRKLATALYGLYIAERRRALADWYKRPAKAGAAAAAAEGSFSGGALDGNLIDVEPDLSTPAPATSPARTSDKPM